MTVAATQPEMLLVRIHPHDPSRGFNRKTFIVHGFGTAFMESKGWYEVDARIAPQLVKFRNNPNDPTSKPVFQVCTREQAMNIDRRVSQKAADAANPIKTTHAVQSRSSVPRPVVLPKETEAPAPAAELPAPTAIDEEFDDAFDEAPASGGDLTTADLVGTPERPKAFRVEEDPVAVEGVAPPIQVPEDLKPAPKAATPKAPAAAKPKKR